MNEDAYCDGSLDGTRRGVRVRVQSVILGSIKALRGSIEAVLQAISALHYGPLSLEVRAYGEEG